MKKYHLLAVFGIAISFLSACAEETSTAAWIAGNEGRSALIIVDMQYDFLRDGSLAVEGGDQIVELINNLQGQFDLVVATQDWHPNNHGSFASNHDGRQPGDVIQLSGLDQVLWPDHCVQHSHGAELVAELDQDRIAHVFQKGTDSEIDSYSGFYDNGKRKSTGLGNYLVTEEVSEVFVVGLAKDYCVKFTALDAKELGFNTTLIEDASRAVNLSPNDGDAAVKAMKDVGINVVQSADILRTRRTRGGTHE